MCLFMPEPRRKKNKNGYDTLEEEIYTDYVKSGLNEDGNYKMTIKTLPVNEVVKLEERDKKEREKRRAEILKRVKEDN